MNENHCENRRNSTKISISVNKLSKSFSSKEKYDSKFIEKWYSPTEHKPSKSVMSSRKSFQVQTENESAENDNNYFPINFRKIKNCLKSSNPTSKFKVLQAIRWRITKTNHKIQERTLRDIQKYNLFNLGHSKTILEELLWPCNSTLSHQLQNGTARLLNAIVSTEIGRNYIGAHSIVNLLVWGENLFLQSFRSTERECVDSHTSDMLIGIMMKLCLDAWQKRDVIRRGKLGFYC